MKRKAVDRASSKVLRKMGTILEKAGLQNSIAYKLLVMFLYVTLIPVFAVGILAVEDAGNLGEEILVDSRATQDSTIVFLNDSLLRQQESFYRSFTRNVAEEYSRLFLHLENRTRSLARHAAFILENPQMKVNISDYGPVWLSPPGEGYNNESGSNWSFTEEDLHPYNHSIEKGLTILKQIGYTMDEYMGGDTRTLQRGYFAFPERITLLYPQVTEALLAAGSDLYPPGRVWFEAAVAENGPIWTQPYLEATEPDTMTITSAMAVRDGEGELLGVVGLDVFLNEFKDEVLGVDAQLEGIGAQAFAMNREQEAIVAPWLNYSAIGKAIEQGEETPFPGMAGRGNGSFDFALQEMALMKSGYRMVEMDTEKYFLSFAPLKGLNYSFGLLLPAESVLGPVDQVKMEIDNNLRESDDHVTENVDDMILKFIGVTTVLFFLVLLVAFFMSRAITAPILSLKEGADLVGKGDLEHRVSVRTGDELENLAESFNNMAAYLDTQMTIVEMTARAKERIERELQIAKEIQKSFLPLKAPEFPGYRMAGINLPAREVGGDFYDFIVLDESRLGIVIADVAGKGVPAALFVGISKTLLRANAKRILDPVQALKEVNSIILEESDSGMFVTLFYAILDHRKNTLTFINAGHNPPILLKKGETEFVLLEANGIPIGIDESSFNLEAKTIPLHDNETVFFYTDGVNEAMNEEKEEFGTTRLNALLNKYGDLGPEELMENIVRELKEFAGEEEQSDDVTMVVLKAGELVSPGLEHEGFGGADCVALPEDAQEAEMTGNSRQEMY